MTKTKRTIRSAMKAGAIVALGVTAFAVASPAFAAGYGNTVNNCRGIYWNTDWNQECPNGASKTGFYESTGDCTFEIDEWIEKYRSKGSKTSYDGPDCTFEVNGVKTTFSG